MNLEVIIKAYLYKNEEATGYDIAKFLKSTTGHSHQQIYRTLRKLERDDYLEFRTVNQLDKPDKKVYRCAHDGDMFVHPDYSESDFTKCGVGYSLLISDILFDKNDFEKYVNHMKLAESEFFLNRSGE